MGPCFSKPCRWRFTLTADQKDKTGNEAQEKQTLASEVNLAQNRNILMVRKGRGLALAEENQEVNWWTRSQRIRTAGELRFQVSLVDTVIPPLYQKIAPKALHLRQLGLSFSSIARHLRVTDKTAAKGIAWMKRSAPLTKSRTHDTIL